ncbi:MAG: amidohydrolase family protein [Chloroflexi bacterium]|nr:amidohydrolase family protein [Chloroflexota bacterium]
MLHKPSPVFDDLMTQIERIPVVDCHEHMAGPGYMFRGTEPIAALLGDYYWHDLLSAGAERSVVAMLRDNSVPTEQKWSLFEPIWRKTEFTAYARVTRMVMRDVYGVSEMSLSGLRRVAEQLPQRTEQTYWAHLDNANIRVVLADALGWKPGDFGAFLSGEQTFPDRWRAFIPLPLFHTLSHHDTDAKDWAGVQRIGGWADRHITSLDEYLEAVYTVLQRAQARGAIGLKDQCAYNRSLHYEVVPRSDAERIFNKLMADPRTVFGWPDSKPLDDYLFHQFMRFARELDMPVQIHTGHMAGIYNRVDRANVQLFATVLELHQDVRFDLFHGNWPYDGDILFLTKNYPNVRLDLCWLYIIDPINAIEMLKRSIVSIPHSKIHAFGGDFQDHPEFSVASLKIAQEVVTIALSELVETRWLTIEDAQRIAADWFFHNPNEFFRLGLEF